MKEILYVQAGSLSNFIGTHFWNTQESYFTYDDGEVEPKINHDISFREGLSTKVLIILFHPPAFALLLSLYREIPHTVHEC